jgi:formylglycine-generating enzyme required for sulfatase activity
VGTHPKGDRIWSGKPVSDLAGNVWEWAEDSYVRAASSKVKLVDPIVHNASPVHVLRGGAWNRSYAAMEVTYRAAAIEKYQVPGIGIRCVRGAPLAGVSREHEPNKE